MSMMKKLFKSLGTEDPALPVGIDLRRKEDLERGEQLARRARELVDPKTGLSRVGPTRKIKLPV
jgi:hypothetical protein